MCKHIVVAFLGQRFLQFRFKDWDKQSLLTFVHTITLWDKEQKPFHLQFDMILSQIQEHKGLCAIYDVALILFFFLQSEVGKFYLFLNLKLL